MARYFDPYHEPVGIPYIALHPVDPSRTIGSYQPLGTPMIADRTGRHASASPEEEAEEEDNKASYGFRLPGAVRACRQGSVEL